MAKETTPLAKAITTLEGQLVIASNVVLYAAGAEKVLPPKYAAAAAVAANVALIVQRAVLKIQASKHIGEILNSSDPLKQVVTEVQEALDLDATPLTEAHFDEAGNIVDGPEEPQLPPTDVRFPDDQH